MTSDAVERYYGQTDPAAGSPLVAVLKWITRWFGATGFMMVWAGIVLLFGALLTPGALTKGLSVDLGLNQLLGCVTVVYYLMALPFFLIPTRDDEQFTWFVVTALGWICCLLCTVLFLTSEGHLVFVALPMVPRKWLLGMLGSVFLIGVGVCLSIGREPQRRLWSATILAVVGGLIATAVTYESGKAFSEFLERRIGCEPGSLLEAIFVCAAAAALVAFVWTFILPQRLENPTQSFGLMLLMIGFAIAGLLCYGLLQGKVQLRTTASYSEFRCLTATAIAAPFIAWLGMPWTRGSRVGWVAGFVLAGLVVAYLVDTRPFTGSKTFLDQMWAQYDGPHLTPHLTGE